jgi:hypothetical protein
LATALLGAFAVAQLYVAARLWGAGRFGSAVGAVVFGTAADVWLIHTQPEVFALHHCLMAGVLVLSAPKAEFDERTILLGLSVLGGLGVAHHHTLVFLAPLGLWAGWRAFDCAGRPVTWLASAVGVFLAAALLPYGYVLWVNVADLGWHWGELRSTSDFVHLLLRGDYGTTTLTSGEAELRPWEQLGYLIFYSARDLLWLPFAGALAALGWKIGGRDHWLFLFISILLAGPVFLSLIGRLPVGVDYLHIRKFHLPFELLLSVPLSIGTSHLLGKRLNRRLKGLLLASLLVTGVVTSIQHLETHQRPTVDQYVRHILNVVPDDAVILGTGDHHFLGTLYMQQTEGLREDVVYLDATLLATKWYNVRTRRQLGAELPFEGVTVHTGNVLDALQRTGRPVFVTHVFHEGLLNGRRVEPFGPMIRVVPRNESQLSAAEIYSRNLGFLKKGSLDPFPQAPKTSWSRYVQDAYAEQWTVLSRTLRRAGLDNRADRAEEVGDLLRGKVDP